MKQTILLLIGITLVVQATAQVPHPKSYMCYYTPNTIHVDGEIYNKPWESAPWTDYFVDIEGDTKPTPYLNTRIKMLWDNDYLYFAAELEETHIWANLKQRDTVIFYDNDFEIFIDPDGNNHEYYEFEINAYGTEWDLFLQRPYRDGVNPMDNWDIQGIKSAVKIYGTINNVSDIDSKWTIEIAMPWRALLENTAGYRKPKHGEQWRINFSRVEWITDIINGKYIKRKDQNGMNLPEHNWVWSPTGYINMHMPEMWGYIQFSENEKASEEDTFNKDIDWDTKMSLMQIYKSQKAFKKSHGYFAQNLTELDIEKTLVDTIKMESNSKQFFASLKGKSGKIWHINHLSKLWYE